MTISRRSYGLSKGHHTTFFCALLPLVLATTHAEGLHKSNTSSTSLSHDWQKIHKTINSLGLDAKTQPPTTPPTPPTTPPTPPTTPPTTPAAPPTTPAAPPAPTPVPQKMVLAYKAQVGQSKKVTTRVTFTIPDEAGVKHTLDIVYKDTVNYTAVTPEGNITYESKTESLERTADGMKIPVSPEELEGKEITTINASGVLVAYKEEGKKADPEETEADREKDRKRTGRLFHAGQVLFPATAVGPGDKWTIAVQENEKLGVVAAAANFELLAFEDKNGIPSAKIKIDYVETKSDKPVRCTGTVWVERSSGDDVTTENAIDNIPDDVAPPTAKIQAQRESGGPLPNSPTVTPGSTPTVPKEKSIDEVVKDFEKKTGVITLYRKKEQGKDTLYAELTEAQLGKLIMLQTTAASGTGQQIQTGDVIDDFVFKFTKSPDDKIYMTVPNYNIRVDKSKPVAKAFERSFVQESYVQSFKIEAKQAERKSYLIDLSELFRGDFTGVIAAFSGPPMGGIFGLGGPAPMGLDREKTYITDLKNFPENLVVTTQYHFVRGGRPTGGGVLPDSRSAPIKVDFNLAFIPENSGYIPRLADSRIGYFTVDFLDVSDDNLTQFDKHYVTRWDLRKKNPKAALSEPIKPIVFWIDNGTPLEYRKSLQDGILYWNKAFEKVGFKDAIVVKQMPDKPDPKDVEKGLVPTDTADMRFNVCRWVVNSGPNEALAVAYFRNNPITGEMVNASISVGAAWASVAKGERREFVNPEKYLDQVFEDASGITNKKFKTELETAFPNVKDQLNYLRNAKKCKLATMRQSDAWIGYEAMRSAADQAGIPGISSKEYTDQLLKETVAHEMGHILGLRHNFVASTEATMAQLGNASYVNTKGSTASLMDYNPFNIAALGKQSVPFYTPTIGSYDYWAIEYGYTPYNWSKNPQEEKSELAKIARRSNEPGHAYESDETVFAAFDPYVNQYDFSAEPLDYAEKQIGLSEKLLKTIEARTPKSGESFARFRTVFYQLAGLRVRGSATAIGYIGGQRLGTNHRNDPNEKPVLVPVSTAEQKRAIDLIAQNIFAPSAFNYPSRYYQKLGWDAFNELPDENLVRDRFARLQRVFLLTVMSPDTLSKVTNNEFKRPEDALTLPYLFHTVGNNVWAELNTGGSVSSLRRDLQRSHLDVLIALALRGNGTGDAQMLARLALQNYQAKLAHPKNNTDELTRLHYADSLQRIKRALEAKQIAP